MSEADAPPISRWVELPPALAALARDGYTAWQAGRLIEAEESLAALLTDSRSTGDRDGVFHALHLLACVAFDAGELTKSRALHEEVLAMCDEIGFDGGRASSLFDLAMIDAVESDLTSARMRYHQARDAFERGGYHERLGVVDAALASRPSSA